MSCRRGFNRKLSRAIGRASSPASDECRRLCAYLGDRCALRVGSGLTCRSICRVWLAWQLLVGPRPDDPYQHPFVRHPPRVDGTSIPGALAGSTVPIWRSK